MNLRRAAVLLLAPLAFACGVEGGPRTTVTDASPAATSAKQPSAADEATLRSALLAVGDLPTGWTAAPAETEGEDGESLAPCGQNLDVYEDESGATAKASFQKSELGDQLFTGLAGFSSGEAASSSAKKVNDIFTSCGTWSEDDPDGTHYEYRAEPVSFPTLGDETFAFRLTINVTGTSDGIPISAQGAGNVITIRRAANLEVVLHLALGLLGPANLDSAETETIARKADEKLAAVS
jgi:hypothetical protein